MITIINATEKIYRDHDFNRKDIHVINTRELDIRHCVGCFGCWVKTPGECFQKDDMTIILKAMMHSELVVFFAEIKAGLIDSELKRVNDKMLPLLLPYEEIVEEEVHHRKRYDSYPELALVMLETEELNNEVFAINEQIYRRMAINFRSKLRFAISDNPTLRRLQDALDHH